ncbi:SpoIIE family protein phosphatase [Bernardetia sp. MNP-M8]|uniref:SpoIIE family protein phosphatase n=1 Tax=Bernardetia sp. MNP-M8 TaxID=3127470 RepID=UPI0030D3214A
MSVASIFGFEKLSVEEQTKRNAFLRITVFSALGGILWGSTYIFFNQYGAVITGFIYLMFVALNLTYLKFTHNYKVFRIVGLIMLLINPIGSQLSLGGFVAGSAVILASSLAPISALTIQSVRASRLFFYSYCLVVILTGVLEFIFLQNTSSNVPKNISLLFFVSNSIVIPAIFYFVLEYFFKQQEKFKKIVEEKNLQLTEQQDEIAASNEELFQQKEELATILEVVRDKNRLIEKQNTEVRSSILYASRIQNALLPIDKKIKGYFKDEFFILNKPRDIVSGDFYWFEKLEDCAIIVTADCTGHGVPGAFMSMLGVTGLNSIVFQEGIFRADKILNHLHDYIYKSLQQEEGKSADGMDVSVLVIYDSIPIAEFAGAMNSIYFIQDNELIELKADKKPIGSNHYGKDRQYSKQIIDISKPTVFYTGSDGYQDQFGGKAGRKFMKKNLKKIALEQYAQPFSKQKEIFTSTIENWMKEGEENQVDDILLMGFKVDRKGIN